MNESTVCIQQIATCVPEHFYTQEFALEFLLQLQGSDPKTRELLKKIYAGTAIEKRHTVISDYGKDPADFTFYPPNPSLKPEPSTARRNEIFIREANRLSLQATHKLLKKLPGFDKAKITHVITVSCTGFSAPGFDLHLCKQLELSPAVHRFHIGFMGCYAAFPALKLARSICLSEPDARVLVVNVELCSLHFQQKLDPDTVVANAIFSDGASALLVSANRDDSPSSKLILHRFVSQFLPNSEQDMAWKIGETGFDMKLSVYVPRLIERNISPIMDRLLNEVGLTCSDIDLWAIHPGGRAILEKVEKTFTLTQDELAVSYNVLREFGNMSSATILFVLERILEGESRGKIFSAAFGPGLTIEAGFLEKT